MSFPNTAYKPGDEVWFVDAQKQVKHAEVKEVVWTENEFGYRLGWDGTTSMTAYELRVLWDGDDLYPTEEAAQEAANKTGSQ